MNKKILAVVFLLVATMAFAADKYISGSGNIIIDPGTSGNVQVKKELRTDSIKDLSGTGTPPGIVPIGGMMMVVPALDTTNAWQPPATGVCKDGFMRADGATVPGTGACVGSPLVGRTLPNMGLTAGSVNRYPRGSAATSWVTGTYTTGGANTVTIGSANLPTHTHAAGTLAVSIDHNHSTTATDGTHSHAYSHAIWDGFGYGSGSYSSVRNAEESISTGGTGTHSHAISNYDVADRTATGSTSDGGFANAAINNEASYLEVVYVIRVK